MALKEMFGLKLLNYKFVAYNFWVFATFILPFNFLQLVDLFCNHDADLLATDQYGMTSLHHAARFGHKGIVKYLIDNGKNNGVHFAIVPQEHALP